MIALRTDGSAAVESLQKIIDGLDEAVTDGLELVGDVGQDAARAKAGPGNLSNTIELRPAGDGWDLAASAPYAGYVERGRGPVVARKGGVLRFEVAGRVIFRPRVGPARPRPFMRPAAAVMSRSQFVERSVDDLVRGV